MLKKTVNNSLQWLKKNLCLVNFVLIASFLLYTILKKNKLIEGFDNNVIDFEALHNLAEVAKKLNEDDSFTWPANVNIPANAKLTLGSTVLTESNGQLLIKKGTDTLVTFPKEENGLTSFTGSVEAGPDKDSGFSSFYFNKEKNARIDWDPAWNVRIGVADWVGAGIHS